MVMGTGGSSHELPGPATTGTHTVPRVQQPAEHHTARGPCGDHDTVRHHAFLHREPIPFASHHRARRRRIRPNSHLIAGMRLQDVRVRPFEEVVSEYGPMVLRVCRAVLGPVDADDAWSETFISAMRAYPALDPNANVEAWLVTIAHRRAIDVGRMISRSPTPAESLPEAHALVANPVDDDPDLWAALDSLPDKQRKAVAYHHLAGLPHAEIAELLGNSPAAARRAAADGIKTLRRIYPKGARS
jgi:RNA polymerase sigma factor (sigma-70 family)